MSKCTNNEVTCPTCGNAQEFTVWDSINVDMDPYLKDDVLNGELFVFTCKECGAKAPVTYPCLYHDMSKHLMVYLCKEPNSEAEMNEVLFSLPEAFEIQKRQGYKYRIVSTVNELAEKIMIHDMGLDDRVVELVKGLILIRSQNDGMDIDTILAIFYHPGENGTHEIVLMFADGKQAVIPISQEFWVETAKGMAESIEKNTEEGYQAINIEWVAKVIQ